MIFNTIEFLDSANKPLPVPDRVRLSRRRRRSAAATASRDGSRFRQRADASRHLADSELD